MGAKKVITGCSGCFRILKWEYPIILGKKLPFQVVHAVEYLRDKVVSNQLKIETLKDRVTYHDPCELARLGGVIEAPREILRAFAKNFVELPENGIDSRCCGGGGLLQSSNNSLRMAVIKKRLDQVKDSGAKILTSSCPACKMTYLDGVREFGYDLEVLDLVELVARQLKIG
jgi:Fe-S oxidoreductase